MANYSVDYIKEQIAYWREQLAKSNKYGHLPSMGNQQFGQSWSESYIRSQVPNLIQDNGPGHDARGIHYNAIEQQWTMNQLHPDEADAFLFVWYDCDNGTEQICLIPTKDLIENCSSSMQHGPGCFNMGSTVKNRKLLEKYMVPSFEALNEVV